MEEVSLDEIRLQAESLENAYWRSVMKTMCELFASSLMLTLLFGFTFGSSAPHFRVLLILPFLINATTWAIWGFYSTGLTSKYLERERNEPFESVPRHEFATYRLYRQKWIERMVDYLTTLQFVINALLMAGINFIR
jgi:hypothetical protein